MSGNPMLSDAAFEKAGSVAVLDRGTSPADEWARAQGVPEAQTMPPPTSTRNAATPGGPASRSSRSHARRSGDVARWVASATGLMFAVLLVGGWWGWGRVDPGVRTPSRAR